MKKFTLKIFITLIFVIFVIQKGICANIDYSKYIVSDNASFLQPLQLLQLDAVLKNLHKETGVDITLITLNSLGKGETFESIEKQVKSNYIFGTKDDKWAMVIVTRNPYEMNIRIGKGLKKIIPPTMRRALGLEFFINKYLFVQSRNRYYSNGRRYYRQSFNYNSAARNIYSTVIFIAEAVADDNNVRLHTNEIREEITPGIVDYTRAFYIPQTDNLTKFMRRYNLFPATFILIVGFWLFFAVHFPNRRRRRWWF